MNAGGFGRGNDRIGIGLRLEPANVFGNRAIEQLDVLRQIADMPAKVLRRPLVERCAVKPHLAPDRLPNADNKPRQRGLARGTWTDDTETSRRS